MGSKNKGQGRMADGKSILIVEDEAMIGMMLEDYLDDEDGLAVSHAPLSLVLASHR